MYSTEYDAKAKQWSGRNVLPLYNPKISLAQALLDSMTVFGPRIAQISDNNGIRMSFDEIRTKSIRFAQNLQARGYKPQQIFGIIAKNSHHVAPVIFGSFAMGCPINTLDPSFGKTELNHMLRAIKPVLMFCDIECYDLVKECLKELNSDSQHTIFTFGGSKDNSEPIENLFAESRKESHFSPVEIDGLNDKAIIICSSVTTGLSKGTLIGATRIITTDQFMPELQLRMIEQNKVRFTLNAPYQMALIMNNEHLNKTDLSSLKYVLVGGSKVPLHIKTNMSHRLPNGNVHVAYGMSEIGGVLTADFPVTIDKDTVGQLVNGSCVKIIDDDGNRCGINTDGQICLKMNFKFLGYYGNQQATNDFFDAEGFALTGDIGHFDEDGFLYIVDRKKDLMKYHGFQIAPSEIDAFLIESPHIKSACVVGIPELHSDLPAAVIIRANGSTITEQEVFDMVADHFADYYKLRGGVYFVHKLPTTPSGKILRRKVKENAIALFNERNK